MILCAAGDTHGAISRMYDDVLTLEGRLGVRFEAVLHVGDLGIGPNKARERHGADDFGSWYAERRPVPRRTIFVKGNEDDAEWLDAQITEEILPGLVYLRNGRTIDLGEGRDAVRVGGLGGRYAPSHYQKRSRLLRGREKAHYTRDEIDLFGEHLDVLLLHDAPAGIRLAEGHLSESAGLRELIARVRPMVSFFSHHERHAVTIAGAGCVGLETVGRAGNLVAFDLSRCRVLEMLGSGIAEGCQGLMRGYWP